jgi:AraC family transcriptional regulator, transcriptional activator FtrA
MPNKPPQSNLSGPRVCALVYDGLCTFEFAIAAEVFALPRPELGQHWYRFQSVAVESGQLRAQGGLQFMGAKPLSHLKNADLIIIPGWKGIEVEVPPRLIKALLQARNRGARIASICSGAFVLAATGLLDGKHAATHWRYAERLAAKHPPIQVDDKVLYTQSDGIYTSAGSAAGIDLMLHIVREDFGIEAANSVARRMVMPAHRTGGQAQYIERPLPAARHTELSVVQERIRQQLSKDWSVPNMAKICVLSERTLLRRFVENTGHSPMQWVTLQRLDEAKRLLESTALSISAIAERVGFGSTETMRHHFRLTLFTSPQAYRAQVRPGGGDRP